MTGVQTCALPICITETVRNAFQQVCGDLGAGVYATAGEAALAFVQQCAG